MKNVKFKILNMRKVLFLALFVCVSLRITAQDIKHFQAYLKLDDMSTRYVAVLADNTIWWFSANNNWSKSSSDGLPSGYSIKHFAAYSKEDGSSRYVAVLADNSIWWYAPGNPWQQSSLQGLPTGSIIKHFSAYSKSDGTRYVAVLNDNSVWWFSPDNNWTKSSLEGLGK